MDKARRNLPELSTVLRKMEAAAAKSGDQERLESVIKSKKLSRKTFFEKASWAILVTGVNEKGARRWKKKAASTGFPKDWGTLAKWRRKDFNRWCKKMAPELKKPQADLTGKFRLKWWSIWDLARYLDHFASEVDFRGRLFDGKTQGRDLRKRHVKRLRKIKQESGRLSMIGHANRYFILRNMGGDFLKPDVWVKEFARWYGNVDVAELASMLRKQGIHRGQFDVYLWSYCARQVKQSSRLSDRFDKLFKTG